MFFPKSSPLMLEFHSVHPLLSLSCSHNSPQNASDINGHGIPHGLFHLHALFFCGLLLSAHPLLFRNSRFTSPRLCNRATTQHFGLVYRREIQPFLAQVDKGPERGKAFGEIGMWDFDGNVSGAAGGVGIELCST